MSSKKSLKKARKDYGPEKIYPLRTLTEEEQDWLDRISQSHTEPAVHVAPAKEILAVANEQSYTKAARLAGRQSGDVVSHLVRQVNQEGIAAIYPQHEGALKPSIMLWNVTGY